MKDGANSINHHDRAGILQANATKVQRRLVKSPHPVEKAADIVEKALHTEGDPYLETAAHTLPWWQMAMLDVYALIAMISVAVTGLLMLIVWTMLAMTVRNLRSVGASVYRKQKLI